MKKFLKNNALITKITELIKNCQLLSGSSFFYPCKYLLILFIAALMPVCLSARQNPDYNATALKNIISLKFDAASHNLEKSRKANPADPYYLYLDNYLHFIHAAIDGDKDSYRNYKTTSVKRIEVLRKHTGDEALYFQAEINFHSFILALYHQEHLLAIKKFFQVNSQMSYFLKHAENPVAGRKLQGILLIIISAIPEEYSWITSLIGLKGDRNQGMALLEEHMQAYDTDSIEYLELLIITTFLNNMFYHDYHTSYSNLKKDIAKYIENPIFRLLYVISALKTGHHEEVIHVLKTFRQDQSEHQICFFDYLYGEALLYRFDNEAEQFLQSFIQCSSGDLYLKSAYKKLAWYHLTQGDTLSFLRYRKLVLRSGSMVADVDKQAHSEFLTSAIPNVDLLKARILFDGGHYNQAKSLLLRKETREGLKNVYQQLEYSYRLARVYHLNDETDKAIRLYELTLKNGIQFPFYYAAHSALQLATICEERGDTAKARLYYHKVLETGDGSYRFRFHDHAREGIKRLLIMN